MAEWDPVMRTMYLNEVYSAPPKQTPVSPVRRQAVVDTLVVDLRSDDRPDEEDGRSDEGGAEDERAEPINIELVQDTPAESQPDQHRRE